ncbi:MAG: hypothetical protein JWR74_1116 [Polaromonas sp.]|nr:hypothetical protein [Polaromonas sp.]
MNQPTNTPPDGDFVRYIERLAAGKVAPGSQGPAGSSGKPAPAAAPLTIDFGRALPAVVQDMPAGMSFSQHVKWVAGLWLATQVLARFVPGAGSWFLPVLAIYIAWVAYTISRKPPGTFLKALSAAAGCSMQKIQKNSTTRD